MFTPHFTAIKGHFLFVGEEAEGRTDSWVDSGTEEAASAASLSGFLRIFDQKNAESLKT